MSSPHTHDDDAQREGRRFLTGRVLAGRYEILERIGEGGTAEVFRAHDHRLDRTVAVKVLRPQFGQDADARARFAVEARTAAGLAIHNIVPIYDFGAADDGSLFIVMRYIEGRSLRTIIAEDGALAPATAIDYVRQIAVALAAAHAAGLVHRDVKPGNILVDAAGTAHLADFGTVKALANSDDLTRSGTVFGTAAYISPEQATNGRIGAHTDIYALGVVLYEALTGEPPFAGDDPVAVSYRHAHEPPVPIATVVPAIDPELAALVMSALEKDPLQRPASANEMAAALEALGDRMHARGLADRALPLAVAASVAQSDAAGLGDETDETDVTTRFAAPPPEETPTVFGVPAVLPPPPPVPGTVFPERGVVAHRELTRTQRPERRGGGVGPGVLVAVLGLLVLAGVVAAALVMAPKGDDGVAVLPTVTPTATSVLPPFTAEPPAVTLAPPAITPAPPVLTPEPPIVTPEPTFVAPTPEPPQPTPEPPLPTPESPQPTPEPPVPTPEPPQPTPEPPVVTPQPPPPGEQSVQVPDEAFVGDYPGDGVYHERTASWVYGQGTSFNTMSAPFTLAAPDPSVPARLDVTGLDGENPLSNATRIAINGVTIYEGPSPFPNDACCGGSGPGNWATVAFDIPAGVLAVDNTLTISNLEPTDCTECPKYVMVDFAEVIYTPQS